MIVVYAGPTISHGDILGRGDYICKPPVSQGDILALVPEKPDVIAIIDGYFDGAPSVWHKEILYALAQGIAVYGCSSMGALRAAELSVFGMVGVGKIFEGFENGTLTDDDEVAVLHGPAEVGYLVASEPMVNIRATLALAEQKHIISGQQRHALTLQAKETFYKQRSWRRLFDGYEKSAVDHPLTADVKTWMLNNRVDLKRQDALELLKVIGSHVVSETRVRAPFHFEWTDVWDTAFQALRREAQASEPRSANDLAVLNQLRLRPDRYERYHDKALLVWLCSHTDRTQIDDGDVKYALKRFKQHNELKTRVQISRYGECVGLSDAQLIDLLESRASVIYTRDIAGNLHKGILDQLKYEGVYTQLLQAVQEKQQNLKAVGLDHRQTGLLPVQILSWYFEQQLGCPIPNDLDSHLCRVGLDSREDFLQLISEEYLYCLANG